MHSPEQALSRIFEVTPALDLEQLPLDACLDRVLAEDLVAAGDLPVAGLAAMDGYAVRARDIPEGISTLRVVRDAALTEGTAAPVATGAPLPAGADAVVESERADGSREGEVALTGPARPGDRVRLRGSSLRAGQRALSAGTTLGPAQLAVAGALGLAALTVVRRPVVAILSVGEDPAQSNAALAALVRQAGALPLDLGVAPDAPSALATRLGYGLDRADAVVTTGGMSAGRLALVRAAWDALGVVEDLWQVAVRPGRPLLVGHANGAGGPVRLFGLAGTPQSTFASFLTLVRPWIRTALGDPSPWPDPVLAAAAAPLTYRATLPTLIRVRLSLSGGALRWAPTGLPGAEGLSEMSEGHGLLPLARGLHRIEVGDSALIQVYDHGFTRRAAPGTAWRPPEEM
ncbi:MAG: molybdopterin molybdotransferase MoeA [Deltaproteobacteria bacterium]|nr:molybdopterin molybdotransferase MoeA [Deltaproteobacteria bacterium]